MKGCPHRRRYEPEPDPFDWRALVRGLILWILLLGTCAAIWFVLIEISFVLFVRFS